MINPNNIIQKLLEADSAYYNTGHPILSDQEYDSLRDMLRGIDPNHPYFEKVGDKPSSLWVKAEHKMPMGSLEKVHTEEDFRKWADKNPDEKLIIQPKLDGLSIELIYFRNKFVQAITRGDGSVGEDITSNIEKMHGLVKELDHIGLSSGESNYISVRCELMLFKQDLNLINSVLKEDDQYKNCRNAASGISRRLDGKFCKYIKLMAYDVMLEKPMSEDDKVWLLNELGFISFNSHICENVQEVVNVFNSFAEDRECLEYNIDGAVIKICSFKKNIELGFLNGRPKSQIAWKFDPPGAATVLNKVTWEVGRTGVVTPLGYVEPVEIEGSTISKVTLHNVAEIKRLGVGEGDAVFLIKAGEIIPKITSVIDHKNNPIKIPTICPSCGSTLENDEIRLFCRYLSCPAKCFQNIMNFIKVTKIDSFGEALAQFLWDIGKLRTPADFFELKHNDIASIEGWGDKSATTIIENINKLRKMDQATFLTSIGIPTLSEKTSADLFAKFGSLEAIRRASIEDISTIKGYSKVSATSIVDGLKAFDQEIDGALKFIELQSELTNGGVLAGSGVCFTGALSRPRSFFQGLVKKHGGRNDSSVTKNTTFLVCNEKSGSSKSRKAEQMGTIVIDEQKFLEMVGENIKEEPKIELESIF